MPLRIFGRVEGGGQMTGDEFDEAFAAIRKCRDIAHEAAAHSEWQINKGQRERTKAEEKRNELLCEFRNDVDKFLKILGNDWLTTPRKKADEVLDMFKLTLRNHFDIVF